MKKSSKLLIGIILLSVILGIGVIWSQSNNITLFAKAEETSFKAYNGRASNILDNVYTKYGLKILPFIYDNYESEVISEEKIASDFQKAGLTIKSISTEEIGTGTQIVTNTETYYIVVYGDVDGNGIVDVFDAQAILLDYVFGGDKALTGIYKLAANVENDDEELDVFDAQRVLYFYVGFETELVKNEPESDAPTPPTPSDTQKPVITLKGANPQYINLKSAYTELGATVTDNIDDEIEVQIDASSVNINTIGTYYVKYNAEDESGNKATEVKRTVIVRDYVKKIEVIAPTKIVYNIAESLDLTNGKVKLIKASGNDTLVDLEASMISGYNANQSGVQTLTVTYGTKTTTFEVTVLAVDDYITGIEIVTNPTKMTYKVGEQLNIAGATFRPIMHSGIVPAAQLVASDMIVATTFLTPGDEEITVSYITENTVDDEDATFTDTIIVTVENYVTGIEVTTDPAKLAYKYGQEVDLTGMIVKAVMADNTKEVISNANVTLDIDTVDLTDDTVTVSYRTDNTDDDEDATFTDTFAITVENYVTGIEITTDPTKSAYVENQDISKTGMVVKTVMADNNKTVISLDNITLTPIKATYGQNSITVSYTTEETIDDEDATFTDTFEISVVKEISEIQFTPTKTTGYRYEEIELGTVTSGINEELITTANLEWIIEDSAENIVSDDDIAKITSEAAQFGDEIIMNFTAKVGGTYTVTPKVGLILGSEIIVTIGENPVVTEIELGDITGNFRVNTTKELEVTFRHQYEEGVKGEVEVKASRITVTGMQYSLLTSEGIVINVETTPNAIVDRILLLAGDTAEDKTLVVTVDLSTTDEVTNSKSITILPEAAISVDVNDLTEITLYTTNPGGNNGIVTDDKDNEDPLDDSVYTLIPICLKDEDGIITKITQDMITDETIQIVDSLYDSDIGWLSIEIQLYKEIDSVISKVTGTEKADYVGIAIVNGSADELRNEQQVVIIYNSDETTLDISIQRNPISEIQFTPTKTTGYRYEEIELGTVTSGTNEELITTANLEWIIEDSAENIVSDDDIAKITSEAAQFGDEIIMNFTAKVGGTYTVTPKVGLILGSEITVTIGENPVVTEIELGDITGNFRVNTTKELGVTFRHQYEEGVKGEVEVKASRITVTGMQYSLLTSEGIVINVETTPNAIVDRILLLAGDTAENKTLVVTVDLSTTDEVTNSKSIAILSAATIDVDVNNLTQITLYTTNPTGNNMIVSDDEYVYTLIPFCLKDEDGVITKITQDMITNGDIEIIDSDRDPDWRLVTTQLYKEVDSVISKVTGTEEATYLGISIVLGESIDSLVGKTVIIKYNEVESKTLTIVKGN